MRVDIEAVVLKAREGVFTIGFNLKDKNMCRI